MEIEAARAMVISVAIVMAAAVAVAVAVVGNGDGYCGYTVMTGTPLMISRLHEKIR
jgi:hypothetical protein